MGSPPAVERQTCVSGLCDLRHLSSYRNAFGVLNTTDVRKPIVAFLCAPIWLVVGPPASRVSYSLLEGLPGE